MPSVEQIVNGLAETSRQWPAIAMAWHIHLGLLVAATMLRYLRARRGARVD